MAPLYLNDWKEDGFLKMVAAFEDVFITPAEYAATESPYPNVAYWLERKRKLDAALQQERWQNIEILLASYGYECYSGDAFVLFRQDGKLYEVNGAHCSCYGLEGQWKPEETTADALRHRLDKGTLGDYDGNVFADELRAVLGGLA